MRKKTHDCDDLEKTFKARSSLEWWEMMNLSCECKYNIKNCLIIFFRFHLVEVMNMLKWRLVV